MPAKRTPTRAQALRWLLFTATEIYAIMEINDYLSAPFRKCTKTAVVEVLVTSWHLLRYLFDSLVFLAA